LKAIILAAGEGKRLRPLTNDKPKCLIEIFGKSLLDWQIHIFHNLGITDISVVTGYKKELFSKYSNLKIYENNDYDSTNMVETLFCARNELNDDVIVSYGDIIYESNVLKKLISSTQEISLIVDLNFHNYWKMRFENPLDDLESLDYDSDEFLTTIGQKISSLGEIKGQYIGLMKFQKNGINLLKEFYDLSKNASINGKNSLNPALPFEKSYMTDLLQGMLNSGIKIKTVPIHGGWLELDSLSDFELYQKKWKDGSIFDIISLKI